MIPHLQGKVSRQTFRGKPKVQSPQILLNHGEDGDQSNLGAAQWTRGPSYTLLFIRVHAAKARDCESSRLVQSHQLLPDGTALLVVGEQHLPHGEVANRG